MYGFDKTTANREQQRLMFQNDVKNRSFSSSLLDEIYRSIDEGDMRSNVNNDMKSYYNETTAVKKQSTKSRVIEQVQEQLTAASIRRSCFLENLKESEKTVMERKSRLHNLVHEEDVMFLSSTSSSSDSSSVCWSSTSDTESLYGTRSKMRVSCFAPRRLKPVITSASNDAHGLIKSKSRAYKIYDKVKQPISPGGKLSNFLNSLFTTGGGNGKKTKTYDEAKPVKSSGQDSTCSTASSYSRSCLSKASSGHKSRDDGVKRTVRFYPVSVIVDEDCRPCGHKSLYDEDTRVMAVSVPTAWKIGRKKSEEEADKVVDKSRRVEETAREFLKEYHRSQRKNDYPIYDDDDEDDAASTSSSDLFELDHLSVIGNNHRYSQELPVFETTHLSANRAIANGLV